MRVTLTNDAGILRAVQARAARTGTTDGRVIEDAVRRQLGFDLLDRLWQGPDPGEEAAETLAVQAQHRTRPPRD